MTKKTILDRKRVGNIIEVFDDAFAKIIQDNAKELDIVLQNLKLLNYQVFYHLSSFSLSGISAMAVFFFREIML